eukprot:gnl/Trimastix_PCT/1444.p1 GENE.gnl/Trimastix_PCT/1444~~gnl/Trimastix_PCT/1444.p1  ORF type:complete len:901 (+),score=340.58 gnl/Trimastix_PCT/1444:88-2790(+)
MKIKGKILIDLATLLIGVVVTVAICLSLLFTSYPSWVRSAESSLVSEEIANMNRVVSQKSITLDDYFGELLSSLNMLAQYARDLYEGNINATQLSSYNGVLDKEPSGRPINFHQDPLYNREISEETSAWWQRDYNRGLAAKPIERVDNSSILDPPLRAVGLSSKILANVYMGYEEDGHFRMFPYQKLDSYVNLKITCGSLITFGFDPRCRQWYTDAKTKGRPLFSRPFVDAGILGTIISAAAPVNSSSRLIGVVAGDVSITALESTVLDLKILKRGYGFLFDRQGDAIIYPGFDKSEPKTVVDLEFPKAGAERTAFAALVSSMAGSASGSGNYTKNGERWRLVYRDIPSAQFTFAMTVPDGDLYAPSNAAKGQIVTAVGIMTAAFVVLVAIVAIGLTCATQRMSQRVIAPVKELTKVTDNYAKGRLDEDIQDQELGSSDLTQIYRTFKGLLVALRFANRAYNTGDIERAARNYQEALNLFTEMNNPKGVAVCKNNLANIEFVKKNYNAAFTLYNEANQKAAEDAKANPGDRTAQLTHSRRICNMAQVWFAKGQSNDAIVAVNQCLQIDREQKAYFDFTKHACFLAEVLHSASRFTEGMAVLDEAESYLGPEQLDPNSLTSPEGFEDPTDRTVARQLVWMTRAELLRETDPMHALQFYSRALGFGTILDREVHGRCLEAIQQLAPQFGHPEVASECTSLMSQHGMVQAKDVMLLLDYSGSMSGSRIKAALRNLLKIFDHHIGDLDRCGMVIFNNQHRVVFHIGEKGRHRDSMRRAIEGCNRPEKSTALYDAIIEGVNQLEGAKQGTRKQWIVALTDGEDNSSRSSLETVRHRMRTFAGGLVIVGIGRLTTETQLRHICSATENGIFIRVELHDGVSALDEAFDQVSEHISNARLNVETFAI